MRRFRMRRGRGIALALVPIVALTATTPIALGVSDATPTASPSSLRSSQPTARYGKTVRLEGRVPGASNAQVAIAFRRSGHRAWRIVRHARTGVAGRFHAQVRARQTGAYRAEPLSGAGSTLAQESPPADPSRVRSLRVVSRTHARVERHAVSGQRVRIRGRVKPGNGHRSVEVKIGGDRLHARTNGRGRFRVAWRAPHPGRFAATVHARRDRVAAGSRDRAGRVTVFRRAVASWYGPGFYGATTACGKTLEPSTLGVANKTLPCGTKVTLRYRGRQVRVPVIDRGPYVAGRDFDLTGATKQRLRFPSTGTVLSSK